MAKYHWTCPMCNTSLELRQRVTLTKRRCPECGTSITPEAIISAAERAAFEATREAERARLYDYQRMPVGEYMAWVKRRRFT